MMVGYFALGPGLYERVGRLYELWPGQFVTAREPCSRNVGASRTGQCRYLESHG